MFMAPKCDLEDPILILTLFVCSKTSSSIHSSLFPGLISSLTGLKEHFNTPVQFSIVDQYLFISVPHPHYIKPLDFFESQFKGERESFEDIQDIYMTLELLLNWAC
ncbi:hypothetical protein CMK14_25190 [Candidatus Poribacteria bacterium]|nr:hypothetical protein [Candidatus Poribacteria bacterium]